MPAGHCFSAISEKIREETSKRPLCRGSRCIANVNAILHTVFPSAIKVKLKVIKFIQWSLCDENPSRFWAGSLIQVHRRFPAGAGSLLYVARSDAQEAVEHSQSAGGMLR